MTLTLNKPYEAFDEVKVGKWLRQEEGKSFIKWLREKREQEVIQLKGERDLIEIGRSQGRMDVFDRILRIVEGI